MRDILVGRERRSGTWERLKERSGVPLIKEAFIIAKYMCMAYAVEYLLKSLYLLNISLHLRNNWL